MTTLAAYNIKKQNVEEDFRHVTAAEELEQRQRPYSQRLTDTMRVEVISSSEDELEFDLIGVDASIANALRRIMLAEVPTVAIEHVYIEMNSSIIHDEVLAHRLGLVPIKVDPREFVERGAEDDANSANTIVFSLDVSCPASAAFASSSSSSTPMLPAASSSSSSSSSSSAAAATASILSEGGAPYTLPVYSSQLVWCPQGDQEERFGVNGIRPVHEDILLAKLRPGQSIKLEAHCQKGVGKDHAKFSPVATAAYRLMPHIAAAPGTKEEDEEEEEEEAEAEGKNNGGEESDGEGQRAAAAKRNAELKPLRIFDVTPEEMPPPGTNLARPRPCTMGLMGTHQSEGWADRVVMTRIPDHFIFKVESTGTMSPKDIVKESLRILKEKCDSFLEVLDNSMDAEE